MARTRMSRQSSTRPRPSAGGPCDNAGRRRPPMTSAPRQDPAAVEAEVREKIHLEILKRTGASRQRPRAPPLRPPHQRVHREDLVTTEPSFTEGRGAVIAKHFAPGPSTSSSPRATARSSSRTAWPGRIPPGPSPCTASSASWAASGASPCPPSFAACSARGPRCSWWRIWCRRGRPSSSSSTWSNVKGDRSWVSDACGGAPRSSWTTHRCSAW